MSISAEEIKESLSVFDIDISDDAVLGKLLEIGQLFGYDADTVVNEWLAYQSTKRCSLTLTNLENLLLEKTVNKNRERNNKTPASSRKRNNGYSNAMTNGFNSSLNEDDESDLLDAYGSPGSAVKRRKAVISTPTSAVKSTVFNKNPIFSPATLSPTTPSSQKYGSRSNSGQVVVRFGKELGAWADETGKHRRSVSTNRPQNIQKAYRYMFQKIMDLSDLMNEMIETISEIIQNQYSDEIESYAPCTMSSQQDIVIVGRICCDQGGGVGRLNPQSVILQGDRMNSYGKSVSIDLGQLEEYSLFPGQVLAMRGSNPTGKKFIATKLYSAACSPNVTSPDTSSTENLSLLIAAGPFTTSDSLSYEPLLDLVNIIKSTKPDVTILIGPFLNFDHPEVQNSQVNVPYEELFQDQLNSIVQSLKSFTELIVVSSQREVSCQPIYPQPPYNSQAHVKNAHFVGDPCILNIDGVKVGVTSNDILFHLGAEEISRVQGSSDRLGRLSRHLLQQRSFYPLFPSNEAVNVDWIANEQFGSMSDSPDILILPSDLKCFVKEVEHCTCVNPGRLAKGMTGGTYAKLLVNKNKDTSCSAEVVKI